VFNYLPVETLDGGGRTGVDSKGRAQVQTMPWTQEAAERLQNAMEDIPYLARISANRALRLAAEEAARAAGQTEVTLDIIEQALHEQGA
jgi:chlorophyllide a reductase subunit Z